MEKLVSGFTLIKNGISLGYPFVESLESMEPLCDEVIVNVGFDDPLLKKDDGTFELLNDHFSHKKFKFLKSYWDPNKTEKGLILSDQTNIALENCEGKYCHYLQGDEVLHEDDLSKIHDEIIGLEKDKHIDALIYRYIHFYGNVDIIKYTRSVYRREIRLIRNNQKIKSWLDAQGFRYADDTKVKAKQIDAQIYHYGWARKETIMKDKVRSFDKLYHGKAYESKEFEYENIWGLKPFKHTHPRVMNKWISQNRNDVDLLKLPKRFEWKNTGLAISDFLETLTNYRMGEYKNFIETK